MFYPICDLEAAKAAAEKLHTKYANPNGYIERPNASQMLVDLYKGIGKGFDPSQGDVESYLKALDFNGDGRVNLPDIEFLAIKYLASDGSGIYSQQNAPAKQDQIKRGGAGVTRKLTNEAQTRLDVARRLFSRFDVDNSKFLDQTEVPNIIIESYKVMGMSVTPTKNDVENWMLMTDTDKEDKEDLKEEVKQIAAELG